jgi:hypothetical protein
MTWRTNSGLSRSSSSWRASGAATGDAKPSSSGRGVWLSLSLIALSLLRGQGFLGWRLAPVDISHYGLAQAAKAT